MPNDNSDLRAAAAILIVGDSAAKRRALASVLTPLGHPVLEADSGLSALDALLERDFAVIVMDVQMPTTDGYETAGLVRRRRQSENTPIIFIAAGGYDATLVVEGYAHGAADTVFSPVSPEILRAKVKVFTDLFAAAGVLRHALEDANEHGAARGQLAAIVESSADAIINSDATGVVTSWNAGATAMYGYTPDEMLGCRFARLFPPDAPTAMPEILGTTVAETTVAPYDSVRVAKDGRRLHVSVSSAPILDSTGRVVGISSISRDISARVAAEADRYAIAQHLQSVIDNTPSIICAKDLDGRFLFVNREFTNTFGLERPAVLGRATDEVFAEDTAHKVAVNDARVVATGEPLHESELVLQDGVLKTFSSTSFAMRDAAGSTYGVGTISTDITEAMRVNATLATLASRQAEILELFRVALAGTELRTLMARASRVLAETTGSPMAHVLEFSAATATMTVVGAWGTAPPPSAPSRPEASALAWRAIRSETPVTVEDYSTEAAGIDERLSAIRVASSAAMLIGSVDDPFGVAAVHDTSPRVFSPDALEFLQLIANLLSLAVARRRSETEREHLVARLVSAREEERNAIAADIHDDAIQVMAIASMRLHLFVKNIDDPVQRKAGEATQVAITLATDRLRKLIFDLVPPDIENVGLEAALRDQVDRLSRELGIPGRLTSSLTSEPAVVVGIALYRVLQEAAANVRKHADARSVSVTLGTENDRLVMRVIDDGKGFAHGAGAQPGHFGLASMRGRIEGEGGAWSITSAPGRGTIVEASLPMGVAVAPGIGNG